MAGLTRPTSRTGATGEADYPVKPEPDFFAEVKSLLGEPAVA